jgi:hypothetical protein
MKGTLLDIVGNVFYTEDYYHFFNQRLLAEGEYVMILGGCLLDCPLLLFVSFPFAGSFQYTVKTSACGQNMLLTVDEANVKKNFRMKEGITKIV